MFQMELVVGVFRSPVARSWSSVLYLCDNKEHCCCSGKIENGFIRNNINAYFIQKQHSREFPCSPFHLRTFIYINMLQLLARKQTSFFIFPILLPIMVMVNIVEQAQSNSIFFLLWLEKKRFASYHHYVFFCLSIYFSFPPQVRNNQKGR